MLVAPYGATPGRSTSHGKPEVCNRIVLELARVGLLQSGLGIGWVDQVVEGMLWKRRLTKTNADGLTIYEQRHPGIKAPKWWPPGAEVTFKPTAAFDNKDKIARRGRKGIMLTPVANPGGSWTGDYLVAEQKHFEVGSERKTARVFQTKTVVWDETMRPHFPIAEAEVLARKIRLAEGAIERAQLTGQVKPMLADEENDSSPDDEFDPDQVDLFATDQGFEEEAAPEDAVIRTFG